MVQPDLKPEATSLLAPQFELTNQDGKLVRLEDLMLERRPVMLVFVSPGCGPCHQLLPDVARWQIDRAAEMRVVLITERPPAPEAGAFNRLHDVLFDDQKAAFEKYHITGTPSALVILPTGHIGSTLIKGPEPIRQYMTATDGAAQRFNPIVDPTSFVERPGGGIQSIGTPVPALSLQTEAGEFISTTAFRGGADTVFLFWNPSCHFCEQMIADLSDWEREKTNATPILVIISPTPPGLNAIPATVLLDVQFRFGSACGITGTPSALATDQDGAVLEPAALGSKSILELLRRLERRSGRREVPETLHAVGVI